MNQENNDFNQNNFNQTRNQLSTNNNVQSNFQPINNQFEQQLNQMNTNIDQIQQNQQLQSQETINSLNYENVEKKQINKKFNKKKIALIIGLIFIVVTAIIVSKFLIFNNKTKNESDVNVVSKLLNDFENGKITADEYVRYNLYAEYDTSLLKKEYSNLQKSEVSIHIEKLVDKYYDQLSDKTKQFYLEKVNLDNITFELDKENESTSSGISLSDIIIDKVYAKSKSVTNLNKVVLSKNKHFIVWYTTTGDNATSYESAKQIADGLENTVRQYDKLTNYKFNFKSNILSKGATYNNQVKILEKSNIDTKYLESAMQVYLVEYGGDSLAQYVDGYGKVSEIFNSLRSKDKNGSAIFPYIMIKPSSFSDYEKLSQLYNHELFHYYQHHVLCGEKICNLGSDEYIGEASANWASSISTKKTTNAGYLNDWADVARYNSNSLMGTYKDKNGSLIVGYALYVYLHNYSTIVNNGSTKIIKSIYEDNSIKYLENNATESELIKIQETIALQNLAQSYRNKNLLSSNKYNSSVYIKGTIDNTYSAEDVNINEFGISYYELNKNPDFDFKINFKRDNKHVSALIIKKFNNKYEIIDKPDAENEYIFDTSKYGDYDTIYLVVYNKKLTLKNYYSLSVEKVRNNENNNNSQNTKNIELDHNLSINGYKFQLGVSLDEFVANTGAKLNETDYENAKLNSEKLAGLYYEIEATITSGGNDIVFDIYVNSSDLSNITVQGISISSDRASVEENPGFLRNPNLVTMNFIILGKYDVDKSLFSDFDKSIQNQATSNSSSYKSYKVKIEDSTGFGITITFINNSDSYSDSKYYIDYVNITNNTALTW